MKIKLLTAPLSEIRNNQCGDWRHNADGSMFILAAEMGNDDYEFCVLLHELIESYLAKKRGITDEAVTAFDAAYEDNRVEGDVSENGDDPLAPYHKEHVFASNMERLMAAELGIHWGSYEAFINSL